MMRKLRIATLVAASVGLAACEPSSAREPVPARDTEPVSTGQAAATPAIEVVVEPDGPALSAGGDVFWRAADAQAAVDVLTVVSQSRIGETTFTLVRGDAGSACPATWFVVQATGDGPPRVSDGFGTCSPEADAEEEDGAYVVRMPAFSNVETVSGTVAYRYAQGGMKPVVSAPPDAPKTDP